MIIIEKQLALTTEFTQEFIEKLQGLKSGYNTLSKKSYNIAYFDFIQASVLIKADKPIEGVKQLICLISKKDWFFKPFSFLFGYLVKKDLISALRLSIYGLFVYSNNESTSKEFSSVIIMLVKSLILLGFTEESILILKATLNRFCYKTKKSLKSYFGFFNELNHGFNLQSNQDNLGSSIEKYSKYELFQEINAVIEQSKQLALIRDSSNDDGNVLECIEKGLNSKLKIHDTNSSYESFINKKVMSSQFELSELRSLVFSLNFREPISQFNCKQI